MLYMISYEHLSNFFPVYQTSFDSGSILLATTLNNDIDINVVWLEILLHMEILRVFYCVDEKYSRVFLE